MAKTTDIAVPAGNALSAKDAANVAELEEILRTGEVDGPEIIDDPAEISRSIIAQLLDAESDEELQGFGEATGWRELLGVPMELHSFKWLRSTIEGGGAPIYFVVNAYDLKDGVKRVLTTGSMNVLAQIVNMYKRGALEGSVWKLVQMDETKSGFHPLKLEKVASSREEAAA